MAALRLALFVEGSTSPQPPYRRQPLERIWNEHLGAAIGCPAFSPIVPISKTHLVAMDPSTPPMSGAGEKLDQLIARLLIRSQFDAAVIAWDLVPAWNPNAELCRWEETLDLYRFLAQSNSLPALWQSQAQRRFEELASRPSPGSRQSAPTIEPGTILALCMEPMFESILIQDEGAIRRALGIGGRVNNWPRRGWADAAERRPDHRVLAPAILAALQLRPKLEPVRQIGGDMRTRKDEWGEFFLRKLLQDEHARETVLGHPIARRLSELVGRSARR